MKPEQDNPTCPYCNTPSVYLKSSAEMYHGKNYGPAYICRPCGAWVGVHKGTKKPLGRLANKELRELKIAAHAAFDPLWREGSMKRAEAYAWLAEQLGIEGKDCHIGMFDEETCRKVNRAVEEYCGQAK